jgi:hypothetical protein
MTMKLMKAAALAPLAAAAGLLVAVVPAGPASASSGDCVTAGKLTTCTFTYTGGAQTWTVPAGIHSATFTLYGAEGGTAVGGTVGGVPVPGGPGGPGAQVTSTLAVTPGNVLQVNVGQAGTGNGGATFGGGGSAAGSYSGAGGGASDVRSPAGGYSLADRLLVAAGGGGGGDGNVGQSSFGADGAGGNADSPGANGQSITITGAVLGGGGGGGAGTTTAGGSAGAAGVITGADTCPSGAFNGTAGAAGMLGAGADAVLGTSGGAGGGGYFGGGSGGSGADDGCLNLAGPGGGAGGASYTGAAASASITAGVAAPGDSPDGEVIITFHKGK